MHGGGGGHMGGGHTGGHVGGHAGGQVNPAHHHHPGSPVPVPVDPGYIANGEQTGHNGLTAAGQRFTPVIVLVGVAVIVAIVILVI